MWPRTVPDPDPLLSQPIQRLHGRIEAAFAAWGHFVVRRRWIVLLVVVASSASVGSYLPELRSDNSSESFLRPNDPARIHYDAFREQFGQDDQFVVAIRTTDLLDLDFLGRLRSFHEALEANLPHVEDVTSLLNARSTRGEGDELVVEDLMADWPESAADLARLRTRILETPLYRGALVNEALTATTITIEPFIYSARPGGELDFEHFSDEVDAPNSPPPEFLSEREQAELIAELEAQAQRFAASDFRINLAGNVMFSQAASERTIHDTGVFLVGGWSAMAVLLFVLFRRASGVLLPLLVVVPSIAVTYGIMALLGIPTSVSGQVLPVLVLAVGVCSAVHLLTSAYQEIGSGRSREDAIANALGRSGLAIGMAALTTAGGLLSFASADLAQVRNLGLTAPIGILLTLFYTVTLLPSVLAVIPLRQSRFGGDALQRVVGSRLAMIGVAVAKRPLAVIVLALALVLVGGVGVAKLRFSQDLLKWFPPDDPMRVASEVVNREFAGAGGVEVWVDTGRENGLHDPALLARLDEATRFAATLTEGEGDERLYTGKVVSILDVVKETHRALNDNRPEFYAIPSDQRLVAQELLLFENSGSDDLETLVDSQFSMARLSIITPFADGMLFLPYSERLKLGFERILGDGVTVRVTGLGSLFSRSFAIVNVTMARSYGIALLVITPLMVLLIGDLRRGLLSMVPNLVPIWLTLGVMGFMDVPIDNSSLLIGCIVLGLAVDDTIHFMHRFQRSFATNGDAFEAIRETLSTTGAALLFTTLVLTSAFLVMATSYMSNISSFGLITAFAAVIAFVADIVLSPVLMALATRRSDGSGRSGN